MRKGLRYRLFGDPSLSAGEKRDLFDEWIYQHRTFSFIVYVSLGCFIGALTGILTADDITVATFAAILGAIVGVAFVVVFRRRYPARRRRSQR